MLLRAQKTRGQGKGQRLPKLTALGRSVVTCPCNRDKNGVRREADFG